MHSAGNGWLISVKPEINKLSVHRASTLPESYTVLIKDETAGLCYSFMQIWAVILCIN
jgi:hypothetical protein